jgi:hypothetical protein
MAMRIPAGENLGNLVAEPLSLNQAAPSGAPLAPLAAGLAAIGERVMRGEIAAEALAKHEREAADRAVSLNTLAHGRITLHQVAGQLGEEVRTGHVDKDSAESEWQRRAEEAIGAGVEGLPLHLTAQVKGGLHLEARSLVGGVRTAVSTKNREDTKAGLLGMLEAAERDAMVDRPRALEKATSSLQTLGPFAGLGADDLAKMMQGVKERTAAAAAKGLVRRARDNPADLDAVLARMQTDEYNDLTPEARGQVEQSVLGRKQFLIAQQEQREARAERAAARHMRRAESSYRAMESLIDNGAIPDDATIAQAGRDMAGTPLAGAFTALLGQAGERAGFASLPPEQQRERILELRARANREGSHPKFEARIERFEAIASKAEKQLADDPLLYGVNRRWLDAVKPLRFQGMDDLAPQLAERVEQAAMVSAQVKAPVSPLLKAEAAQAAEMLRALPSAQQEQALRKLATALPDAAMTRALAAQIGGKDATLGLAMFAASAPDVNGRNAMSLILRGADAIKAGRMKPASEDPSRRLEHVAIARELSAVPWATTQARDAAVEAAQRVYDGLKDSKGSASAREAVRIAVGGGLTEWAGAKVPLPPGMEERRFRRALTGIKPEALARQAGGPVVYVGSETIPVEKLAANMGAVQLIPAGAGVYALQSGGAVVLDAKRRPLRLRVED